MTSLILSDLFASSNFHPLKKTSTHVQLLRIHSQLTMSSPRRSSGFVPPPNQHHQGTPSNTTSFLELSPQHGWQMMSTRGQSLPRLLRRYSHSEDNNKANSVDDLETGSHGVETAGSIRHLTVSPTGERPRRRGSILIGDTRPAFRWCFFSHNITRQPCEY